MSKIKFIQPDNQAVGSAEKEFTSFKEVRDWVLADKREGYGDVLAYGGYFEGLSEAQVSELNALTYDDAIEPI